jgi:hypothetical protein
MLTMTHQAGKLIELKLEDQLTAEDYRQIIQPVRSLLTEQKQINILVEIKDFNGWDAVGLWQEAKSDLKLRNQISRIALVGEASYEAWGQRSERELPPAQVRFFTALPAARDLMAGK